MSEILGALFAIMAGLMYLPQVTHGIAAQRQIMADVTTAQQQQQWAAAVSDYVKQNNATFLSSANAATPVAITVATVKAANVGLPASFSGTNPFNQTWAAGVLQPTAGTLQVLIYATGGNTIKDEELGSIARASNGAGGFIPTNNSGAYPGGAATAHGAFGAWTMSTAGFGATGGVPASLLTLSNGALTSNALYRYAVAGQPQLNQMQTAIDMNNNNVNNAATVNAKFVVTPAGNSVQIGNSYVYGDSTNTALRQNGNVYLQSPDASAWKDLEAGNVNSNGAIWTSGNVAANGNVNANGTMNANGSIWTGSNLSVSGNTYMGANTGIYNGGTQYIDTGNGASLYLKPWTSGTTIIGGGGGSGNLLVTGAATINGGTTMGANTTISNPGTQYIEAAGNLYLKPWNGNGITVVGGGGGSGQLFATGRLQTNEYVQINGGASPGAGCSPNGLIGNSGSGPLFCTNGVWKAAGSGTNNGVSIDVGPGGTFWLPSGTTRVDGYIDVAWNYNNAGVAVLNIYDTAGNLQNVYQAGAWGPGDGGGGSEWWIPVSIPVYSNSARIDLQEQRGTNAMVWHISGYTN